MSFAAVSVDKTDTSEFIINDLSRSRTQYEIWWTRSESNRPHSACKASSPPWYMPAHSRTHFNVAGHTRTRFTDLVLNSLVGYPGNDPGWVQYHRIYSPGRLLNGLLPQVPISLRVIVNEHLVVTSVIYRHPLLSQLKFIFR